MSIRLSDSSLSLRPPSLPERAPFQCSPSSSPSSYSTLQHLHRVYTAGERCSAAIIIKQAVYKVHISCFVSCAYSANGFVCFCLLAMQMGFIHVMLSLCFFFKLITIILYYIIFFNKSSSGVVCSIIGAQRGYMVITTSSIVLCKNVFFCGKRFLKMIMKPKAVFKSSIFLKATKKVGF